MVPQVFIHTNIVQYTGDRKQTVESISMTLSKMAGDSKLSYAMKFIKLHGLQKEAEDE